MNTAAQKVRVVDILYTGFSAEIDADIRKAAGTSIKEEAGSGFSIMDSQRDLSFFFHDLDKGDKFVWRMRSWARRYLKSKGVRIQVKTYSYVA